MTEITNGEFEEIYNQLVEHLSSRFSVEDAKNRARNFLTQYYIM